MNDIVSDCRLALSGVSITPSVAKGLSAINAVSLARLVMPEALRGAPEAPVAQNTPMARAKGQTRGQTRAAS